MRIGVLALQGDVEEHAHALSRAASELGVSAEAVEVKAEGDLAGLDGLILPGGESTTMWRLLRRGLLDPLRDFIASGAPVLATCAGLILLAKRIRGAPPWQRGLEALDVEVARNAFGRQRESFKARLAVKGFGEVDAVFIRAPAITSAWGSAEPLASLRHGELGLVHAAVRQNNVLATAFHPELTTTAFHKYLLQSAKR
jgi:5'-phosphate synthase pdxT subunit|nr:MAG: glutamine amidotransferase [Vulcanisaeta sp. AZ3]